MDLIVFSHLRWDFVFQRPQHLLSRLARHHRVVFFEEPVFDAGQPRLEVIDAAPNIRVLRPHTPILAGGYHDEQLPTLQKLIDGYVREQGLKDYGVWFYTPMALPLLSGLQPSVLVYDCMDELSAFRGAPPELLQREATLLRQADLVFTGGPSLYEAKRHANERVLCLPSAVDAAHFDATQAASRKTFVELAESLQGSVPHPRLGFYGVIDERIDLDLVQSLAEADRSWQLVMVGPVVKIDPATLPQRANIHWLGQQSYDVLPQLVAGWDVCLMPFALNESTRFISPTKTLEYMAAGKPVVSTGIHDVISLYGSAVHVGRDAGSFIAGCREALAETPAMAKDRLQRMAGLVAQYSWDRTAATIHEALQGASASAATKRKAAQPVASAGGRTA